MSSRTATRETFLIATSEKNAAIVWDEVSQRKRLHPAPWAKTIVYDAVTNP